LATLVLGLGNPILSDDGVGIHVVRAVAARWQHVPGRNGVHFSEASVGGLRLLDYLMGYERVVLVDAVFTGSGQPGQIHRLRPGDLLESLHSGSTHDLSLSGALALGRGLGLSLPSDEDIAIFAVEVEDVWTFGESCTPAVARAIAGASETVLAFLEKQ
jgi:hydrogenase maturation protease